MAAVGHSRLATSANRNSAANTRGVMTVLIGMPINATPRRQSAVSPQVARRFRAWAAKKVSRSAGPGTERQGRSVRSAAVLTPHPLQAEEGQPDVRLQGLA